MDTVKKAADFLKTTVKDWLEDDAPSMAAALAFYTLLSLAPLLLVIVSVAGLVLGDDSARSALQTQANDLAGEQAGSVVGTVLDNAKGSAGGIIGTAAGVAVLLFGATGVFAQLQKALNRAWEVEPIPGSSLKNFLMKRLLSLTAIIGIGFLLLVSLVLSAAITAIASWVGDAVGASELLLRLGDIAFSLVVFFLFFVFTFKVLPDVRTSWSDVWVGALVTAVLFVVGKTLIGLYLGHSSTGSSYGAFGSLVVLLIWIYYSAQILFFGAEFTQVWSRRFGRPLEPERGAQWLPDARRQVASEAAEVPIDERLGGPRRPNDPRRSVA